jgi:ABC-type polysaccharide/polyol phosphate export permease
MFETRQSQSTFSSTMATLELIYHSTVREVRKGHRNAIAGLLMSMVQTVVMIAAFYFMFALVGVRNSPINDADYLVYLMSGIFLFMVHSKTMGAVAKADGPASAMMQHAPLTTFVAIASAALAALYLQLLSLFTLLFLYHAIWSPVVIDDPVGAMAMLLLAWFSGIAIRPWSGEASTILTSVWSRANMVASGKMFLANNMPTHILVFFWWNPLFHIIDQARGAIFINYSPHYSDWRYALWVSLGLFVIGLMAENFTRRRASASWGAAR